MIKYSDRNERYPVGEGDYLLAQLYLARQLDYAPLRTTLWVAANVAVDAVAQGAAEFIYRNPIELHWPHNTADFYIPIGTGSEAENTIGILRANLHSAWKTVAHELAQFGMIYDINTQAELFMRVGGLVIPGYAPPAGHFPPPDLKLG